MKISELTNFLYKASQSGYATGQEKEWIKEKDGSTTIFYKDGDWEMNDNYFGGEPFGGRLTIFYKKKPVWIMVYYGFINPLVKQSVKTTYRFLRTALSNPPKDFPLRGQKKYEETDYRYENIWNGEVAQYSGTENIFFKDSLIYTAFYAGGWVDRRSG